jgi:hypothetical protein
LVGQRQAGIWLARKQRRTTGTRDRVEFDGPAVLAREEARGDVVGFLHTHPSFAARPSQRDIDTMRAWAGALGKPLVCLIRGADGLAGYRFDDDEAPGVRMSRIELFARGAIVAID